MSTAAPFLLSFSYFFLVSIQNWHRYHGFLCICCGGERGAGRTSALAKMYLMYYINDDGSKVYTMKKESPDGTPTKCAHPARFSPDDKFSKQRMTCKRRFGLLPTQGPPHTF